MLIDNSTCSVKALCSSANALWAVAQKVLQERKPDLFSYSTNMISRWGIKTALSPTTLIDN
jgi:hypothetical protein